MIFHSKPLSLFQLNSELNSMPIVSRHVKRVAQKMALSGDGGFGANQLITVSLPAFASFCFCLAA
jgi:hypothetical protein